MSCLFNVEGKVAIVTGASSGLAASLLLLLQERVLMLLYLQEELKNLKK